MSQLREKLKVRFTFHIVKAVNIPKGAKSVFLEWRRGSRRRTGKTRTIEVNGNEALWNEDFVVETKIETSGELDRNQTLEARNFQEKKVSLSVKEGKKSGLLKSYRSIGKAYLNLSEYIRGDNTPVPVTKVLSTKAARGAGKEPTITFSIKSELLKLGRVALTPVRDPAVAAATPRSTINLGGTNYLVRPEEAHTETTLDSDSDSQGGEDFQEEDEDSFNSSRSIISEKPTVAAAAGSNPAAAPQLYHRTTANNLPTKTATAPTTTMTQNNTVISTSATTPSDPPATTSKYQFPVYTPPPAKSYSNFAERPLLHKILAVLVFICAFLFLRVTISSSAE